MGLKRNEKDVLLFPPSNPYMAKIKRFIQLRCIDCVQEEELKQIKSFLDDVFSTYSVIYTKNFPLRGSSLPRQGLYASSSLGAFSPWPAPF